jgi:asparagine synthase (glutamine-hydrolysing)
VSAQAGVWNLDGRPVGRALVEEMSGALRQLGPDGKSYYLQGATALIYRAFHTTYESRQEKQPYISHRGFVLTWDGRLDNRKELIADLRTDLGIETTDVAVVAAALDRWQDDAFHRFIGDWAVTIWLPQRHELILASDCVGVRHLFYHLRPNQLRWSTDISSLLLSSKNKFHIDEDYIAGYLAHNPTGHLSPYREIRQVSPGHFLRVQPGKAKAERFWRFSPGSRIRYKSDVEYEHHFRHLFRQSVHRRLRSDSPVLAELSGGLDSSSIVCMADDILAKEGADTPRLETLSFFDATEPNGDDWFYFQKIERRRGRTGVHIDASKIANSSASLEFCDFNPFPGALGVGKELGEERALAVRESGCRVVLSGLGGDEFMGGIPDPRANLADLIVKFRFIRLARQLTAWSLIKRRPWIHLFWDSYIIALPSSVGQYFVRETKVEPWIRSDFAHRTRLGLRQFDVDEHFGLWLPSRRSLIAGFQVMANNFAKATASIQALEEARYPYLDQNLIEFVLSTPADQWLRPGDRRSLLRRALKEIVPAEILSRRTKQIGARTPILVLDKHWDEIKSIYRNSLSSELGYVDDDVLIKTISNARAGKTVPMIRVLWTLSLEFWLRDLARRGLIEVPATSGANLRRREMAVSA